MVQFKFNNHAASLILHLNPTETYPFQRKTPGYPIDSFVDTLCFFGGSWTDAEDKSPLDTLLREITEEFEEANDRPFLEELTRNIQPFADYMISVPKEITGSREMVCCFSIFNVELSGNYDLIVNEGEMVDASLDDLRHERFCFGYEQIFNDFIGSLVVPVEKRIKVARLDTVPLLDYAARDLDAYKRNPLRERLSSEDAVFELQD